MIRFPFLPRHQAKRAVENLIQLFSCLKQAAATWYPPSTALVGKVQLLRDYLSPASQERIDKCHLTDRYPTRFLANDR